MKFAIAFAVAALGATGVAAYADQANRVIIRHHGGAMMDMDANHDGWLTRAEAAAGADRMFDHLDTNHDGRLTDADRAHMDDDVDVRIGDGEGAPGADDENCTRSREGNRITVICNGGGGSGGEGGQRVERRVIIRPGDHAAPPAQGGAQAGNQAGSHVEREVTVITRDGDDDDDMATPEPPAVPEAPRAPAPPRIPHPPHPPMFMMLMANSEEMDTNHDGAISREEFRAQQLRFFDASDANGDGRIRFEPPPEPPVPPAPPAAPVAPVAPTPPPTPR